ncbi:hypothetical protein ACFSHP_18735 [Novosphingobium panipatense]
MTASAPLIGMTGKQADVVTFLESPGALKPGETARRIDTHAAHIFLAGDRAWKLKQAVHYDYLDFSSVDKRRAALEAELSLNRRTAPSLYLAVRPICRDGTGKLNMEGQEKPSTGSSKCGALRMVPCSRTSPLAAGWMIGWSRASLIRSKHFTVMRRCTARNRARNVSRR